MVRYAMGESIPYEEMVGSKRLWIAALRGSDQSAPISPNALCATDEKDNRELLPPNWKLEFRNEIGDFAHPKACDISLGGEQIRRWSRPTDPPVTLGAPFDDPADSSDSSFLSQFLKCQVRVRDESTPYRNQQPLQLDWYWISLLNNLILRSTKKDEILALESGCPWLEGERPLTYHSALALWLASLTKGDRSKMWLEQVWANLVDTDRLNHRLLLQTAKEISSFDWCIVRRWGEILSLVASRSNLHAWEIGRLALGLLLSLEIDQKDAIGLIEIILQSYTTLGIQVTPTEREALSKYSSGKCKKALQDLFAIPISYEQKRRYVVKEKLMIRIQRANRWANAVPSEYSVPIQLSDEEIHSERLDFVLCSKSDSINAELVNQSYFRRRWIEYKSWIVSLLEESKQDIIWPRIQIVAKQLKAEASVDSIKSAYKPKPA